MCSLRMLFLFKLLFIVFLSIGCGKDEPPETSLHEKNLKKEEIQAPGILFFGNSLTAGMGLLDPDEEAWPALIGKKLKQEGYTYEIWNAGLSGDTTTSALSRLNYVLVKEPEIFVLELGANDSMRGISPSLTKRNLENIIQTVRGRYQNTKILLIGMQTFPNLGIKFKREFDAIYPELARSQKVLLVPFLLEGVAGERHLNQEDGIHPTKEGHEIMANTVYPYIKKLVIESRKNP